METLQDIMTAPVLTVTPDTSVGRALGIMEQEKLSALIVAEKEKAPGNIHRASVDSNPGRRHN